MTVVVGRLRSALALALGELPPGSHLRRMEEQIENNMGLSFIPVREALTVLEGGGFSAPSICGVATSYRRCRHIAYARYMDYNGWWRTTPSVSHCRIGLPTDCPYEDRVTDVHESPPDW